MNNKEGNNCICIRKCEIMPKMRLACIDLAGRKFSIINGCILPFNTRLEMLKSLKYLTFS
jgi:hypothetical protein